MTTALIGKAQRIHDARQFTMAKIAASCGVSPMAVYCNIRADRPTTRDHVGHQSDARSRSVIMLASSASTYSLAIGG